VVRDRHWTTGLAQPRCSMCKSFMSPKWWESGNDICPKCEENMGISDVYLEELVETISESELALGEAEGQVMSQKDSPIKSLPDQLQKQIKEKVANAFKNNPAARKPIAPRSEHGFHDWHSPWCADDDPTDRGFLTPSMMTSPLVPKPLDRLDDEFDGCPRSLYITGDVYGDIFTIVRVCPIEVSGLGIVEQTEQGLILTKIYLLEQLGGAAHTELDDEGIAKVMQQVDAEGIDTGKIRCWWHSHVGMPTNPSARDMAQFNAFGQFGVHGADWWLSLIVNRKQEIYCRMDLYKPVRVANIIPYKIGHPTYGGKDWVSAIRENVRVGPQTTGAGQLIPNKPQIMLPKNPSPSTTYQPVATKS